MSLHEPLRHMMNWLNEPPSSEPTAEDRVLNARPDYGVYERHSEESEHSCLVVSQESHLLVGFLDNVLYVWVSREVAGDVDTKAFSSWYLSQDLATKLVKRFNVLETLSDSMDIIFWRVTIYSPHVITRLKGILVLLEKELVWNGEDGSAGKTVIRNSLMFL